MKIAVLADIHGNLPALRTVLKHIRQQQIEDIWYLGDFVGYGPFPNEVIKKLISLKAKCIVGNHDLKVLSFPRHQVEWKKKKDPAKYFSFRWSYQHLSEPTKRFIRKLPKHKRLKAAGKKFLLVHGSPDDIEERLYPDTPKKRFAQLAAKCRSNVILSGHTHQFMDLEVQGVRFINPGTVGRPFDEDPRASYAVLEISENAIKVRNYRLTYPIQEALKIMEKENFPSEIAASISRAMEIEDIRKKQKTM